MAPIAILFVVMAASMFGAFELALPSGLQQRLSSIGGRGFFGAFAMGLVGGIIAAPCTGPVLASILAYVATTKSVFLGGSLARHLRARHGRPLLRHRRVRRRAAEVGRVDGSGQEHLRRRHARRCALLLAQRRAVARRHRPLVVDVAGGLARAGRHRRHPRRGASVVSRCARGARAQGARRRRHGGRPLRRHRRRARAQARRGRAGDRVGARRGRRAQGRARACIVRRCSTSMPTGACPAKSSSSRPSAAPRSRARWRSSRS